MFDNDTDKELMSKEFKPPKLPFGWLATTFIAPVAVAFMPNIFTDNSIPLVYRAIAGLVLLSVMLFVSCIILMLQIYNKSYAHQIIRLELQLLKEQANTLNSEIEASRSELTSLKKDTELDRSRLESNSKILLNILERLESQEKNQPIDKQS